MTRPLHFGRTINLFKIKPSARRATAARRTRDSRGSKWLLKREIGFSAPKYFAFVSWKDNHNSSCYRFMDNRESLWSHCVVEITHDQYLSSLMSNLRINLCNNRSIGRSKNSGRWTVEQKEAIGDFFVILSNCFGGGQYFWAHQTVNHVLLTIGSWKSHKNRMD